MQGFFEPSETRDGNGCLHRWECVEARLEAARSDALAQIESARKSAEMEVLHIADMERKRRERMRENYDRKVPALIAKMAGNFEPMSPETMLSQRGLSSRIRTCRNNRYDALLERLERLRGLADHPVPSLDRVLEGAAEMDFSTLEAGVNRLSRLAEVWQTKVERLRMEYGRCKAMLEFARSMEGLGLPLSLLASSPYCRMVLGSLTAENWQRLREIGAAGPVLLLPLFEDGERVTVAAFCERSYGEALDKLLAGVHLRAFETAMQELSLSSGDELAGRLDFLETEIEKYREMPALYARENRFERCSTRSCW